jgi:hypothetical protein
MTDADLDRIEAELAVKLPAFYRAYMRDYPRWLADQQPAWSDVTEWEFADDPNRVIHFNRVVRRYPPGAFFDDGPWPLHYFVIGSEQEQNWYFLNLETGDEAVYWFHHEMGEVGQVCKTLSEFPQELLVWWRDVERAG